ncbi:MAG TPA: zf-HC2 domain-containing protein [bacterium]|nr:zf-HC2 domain-containing protein [bacterium]
MPSPDEMTCRDLVETVTEYLEGTLGAADRARFEAHVAECPPCRDYLEQMRDTVSALGRLPRESISEDAKRGLLDAFRNWKRRLPP